jgi:hypothetical protein
MANASYAAFHLKFQWRWSIQAPGAAIVHGAWSPVITNRTDSGQPSTLYPAPLVIVRKSAAVDEPVGGKFWIDLGGNVSGTSFRFVIETTNGKEVRSSCTASASGATSYNDTQPLEYTNGTELPAGTYLIHIHNAGAAIVVFAKLKVT